MSSSLVFAICKLMKIFYISTAQKTHHQLYHCRKSGFSGKARVVGLYNIVGISIFYLYSLENPSIESAKNQIKSGFGRQVVGARLGQRRAYLLTV